MKKCNKCLLEKELLDFPKKGGICKKCYSERSKEYYIKNKERILERVKEYTELNKDIIKEYKNKYNKENYDYDYQREYRESNKEIISLKRKDYYQNNKEKIKQKSREYINENRDLINNRKKENRDRKKDFYNEKNRMYIKKRKETEPIYRLICNIRTLISQSFKNQFTKKSKKTSQILGCSFEEFRIHIESLFTEEMNWSNYATYWQLDHKIPISWANSEDDVYRLNHYTNFKPMYWRDNIIKGNRSSD
jgi:hypothetical protein